MTQNIDFGDFDEDLYRPQAGPFSVTFTCFVDPAPPEDITIGITVKSSSGAELLPPTLMNHARGNRNIWSIQRTVSPAEFNGLARGRGGVERLPAGGGLQTLFSVTYLRANATTRNVIDQDPGYTETELYSSYYHKAKFGRETAVEPFPSLIFNEVREIHFSHALLIDFDRRFEELLETNSFSTDVKLFHQAIASLLTEWARERPSTHFMVVITAMIGIIKKREDRKARGNMQKERFSPLPENICRYVVERWRTEQIDRIGQVHDGPARESDFRKIHRVKQKSYDGLRECAETLYMESHSFAWLPLLEQAIDYHRLPSPISISEEDNEAAAKNLSKSFERQATRIINDLNQILEEQTQLIERTRDERHKRELEMQLQSHVERVLGGLFRYPPSIVELRWLFDRVSNFVVLPRQTELGELCRQRFRDIRFGPEDKKTLKQMIREVKQIQNEDTANSLLENGYHPDEAFQAAEMIDMVKEIMEKCGNQSNGKLVEGIKRWLKHHYRYQYSKDGKAGSGDKYEDEVRKNIVKTLTGWELALSLPCYDKMQENQILFDLEFSRVFKDSEPITLISCLLELEDQVLAIQHSGLRDTVSQVANRTIRGVQETVEQFATDHILLQQLFQAPTPLRYEFIEVLMQQRAAFPGLDNMLNNEALWHLLLSDVWDPTNAKGIGRSNLGSIQADGKRLLDNLRKNCKNATVTLGDLSVIEKRHEVFVDLAKLVTDEDLRDLVSEVTKRHGDFDRKHEQLGVYAMIFCSNSEPTIGHIDVKDVIDLVEEVRDDYDKIQLDDAMTRVDKVLVWPHLDFLYALRGSNVFAEIWTSARGTEPLTQEQVVGKVIKEAQKSWENLANGIVSGSIVMGEVKWIVQYPVDEVKTELKNLEQTSKARGDWAKVQESADSMRLANRLRDVAPAVLTVRKALQVLFTCTMESDPGVPSITKLQEDISKVFDTQIGQCSAMVAPHRQALAMLTPRQEDFFLRAATKTSPVSYLIETKEAITLEGFNGLIEVCRPMTDDPRVLGALAAMQQVRTQLAQAFYEDQSVKQYNRVEEFLDAVGGIDFKDVDIQSLEVMQVNFDPLQKLLQSKSRSPGVQACFDLKMLCESGTFVVTCTPKRSEQIVCQVSGGKPWHRQELQDLGQQLLMTDVPEEIEGHAQLLVLREQFLNKCQLLNAYSQYIQDLFNLGYFALEEGEERLQITPKDSVEDVLAHVESIKRDLETWESDVTAARGACYFLNYFTVFELRILAKSLHDFEKGSQHQNAAWSSLWPLFRTVAPKADADTARKRLSDSSVLSNFADIREARLEYLGEILNILFNDVVLQIRPLKGLPQLNADEQSDLIIRKNADGEAGVPMFVLSVDDETKVTEAVLSIYARRERVPEAEELVFCNNSTTAEEIELLARRFFTARSNDREDRVFCLCSVHLLPYGVQCRAAEMLRWLEERLGFKDASCLAAVSGGPRQQVLSNAMLSRKAQAVGYSKAPRDAFLREAVIVIGREYHGRQIEAFASEINGAGKTHSILSKISEFEEKEGCPVYHRVELRESTDTVSLTEALTADPTDETKPTAIHLNLAHILPIHVDTLLFQLLVVGVLHDPRLGVIYHRRREDMFFVEIPNTPNEHTAKSLPFMMLLPRTFLKMKADALDYYLPVISNYSENAKGPSIIRQKNEAMVIVTKYLLAMENEAFNPLNKTNFKIDWDRNKEEELQKEQAYEVLNKACALEGEAPSFLLFTGFVNFFSNLIQLLEKFPVGTSLTLQKQVRMEGLKHSFIRLLIETSRAFALRQIPKGHADFETHPLAPQEVSAPTIMRQLSLARETSLQREISLKREASGAGGSRLNRQLSRQGSGGLHTRASVSRKGSGSFHTRALSRQGTALSIPEDAVVEQSAATVEDTQSAPVDALAVETSGVGRIVVTTYVSRFAKMQSWESISHPVAYFGIGNTPDTVKSLNVMCLNHQYTSEFVSPQLQKALAKNNKSLDKDWSLVPHHEQVKCLLDVEGMPVPDSIQGPEEYVVTVDNLLKLMTIQQRLKYGLPVCLMGETGCGKTALVRFLSKTLEVPLLTLDIHGGITEIEILEFMDGAIRRASDVLSGSKGVMVFFDEVNACNCLGLFKTLIIDRMHRDHALPKAVRIISCCNPYRTRMNKEDEQVGCQFEHKGLDGEASGITDPMRDLVYRVHPLPESLMDIVSDFGALSENSESLYIRAILAKELMPPVEIEEQKKKKAQEAAAAAKAASKSKAAAATAKKYEDDDTDYDQYISAFRDLICCSQSFVRQVNNGERSVVSMRDVARAVKVCKWFLTYYAKILGVPSPASLAGDSKQLSHGVSSPAVRICVDEQMRQHLRSAVILTLGYCYHARLNRADRQAYLNRLTDTFAAMAEKTPAIAWLNLGSAAAVDNEIIEVQSLFVREMQLGEGIALNEALRENLFMLLVSIMNQIPILIVGKPGCSKSLAMDVLKVNLNGEVSEREFFRSMPALSVIAYQCSPLSTPDAILYAFNSARKSNIGDTNRIVCVLLDEVGLAEESPHLPLKVLHRELEHLEGIACVGISNWSLDAAKMNRCVMLYRPPPTVEDLRKTAEGMAGRSANLKAYLHSLSEAFYAIYTTQVQKDFWGMREFYSTVRALSNELKLQIEQSNEQVQAITPKLLMKVVQRNFGGRMEDEMEGIIEEYFDRLQLKSTGVPRIPTDQLIRQNLMDKDARHLMLLTKNNAALRLLFGTGLLAHQNTEILFGGTFPSDQSDLFVASNLQRVKTYMQRPCCLIMIHCDALYESLYDVLNQHYMEYAGQRYVRIAHGSLSKQCPIHKMFRIIVVVEQYDAYNKLAPPLLNRFEKQIFQRRGLMEAADIALSKRVDQFWTALMSGLQSAGGGSKERMAIAGHHSDILASLVFALRRKKENAELVKEGNHEELFQQARSAMIWVLTPEAVCLTAASNRSQQAFRDFDIVNEYFQKQMHVDLPGFISAIFDDKSRWCDETGSQVVAMTYSPLRGRVADITRDAIVKDTDVTEVMLHELAAGTDLEKAVNEFYKGADTSKDNLLLIRADTAACSLRQIEYARCMCEKARYDYSKEAGNGAVIVVLLIHLERGDSGYSFDFVSDWQFVFLDSIEPVLANDMCGLPGLSDMLHVPLLKVLDNCDFKTLLKRTFRAALAQLVYKQRRQSEHLQAQVQQLMADFDDDEFVGLFREWTTTVLQTTRKNSCVVGEDAQWFADVAGATHELMLSGTLRAGLHQRILTMIASLFSTFMAHLDRNGCYELFANSNKRNVWLLLAPASTVSAMASKLKREGEECVRECTALSRDVPTDALTQDQPFRSQFPFSWFISKTIDDLQRVVKAKASDEHEAALDTSWKMTPLHGIGFNPCPTPDQLDDYIADFTAMHVDFMHSISRSTQHQILRVVLKRANGGDLVSILDVHRLFWAFEQQIRFCLGLVDAVPTALSKVEKIIETAPVQELNARLLLTVHRLLIKELEDKPDSIDPRKEYLQWMHQKTKVAGITGDFFVEGDTQAESPLIQEIKNDTEPRIDTIGNYIQHVAYPLQLKMDEVKRFISDMANANNTGQVRCSSCFASILKATDRCLREETPVPKSYRTKHITMQCRLFVQSWILDVCLANPAITKFLEQNLVALFCHLATGLPLKLELSSKAVVTAVGLQDEERDNHYDEDEGLPPLAVLTEEFLPRPPSLSLALLRKLMNGLDGEGKQYATATLKELLKRFVQWKTHNDSVFAKNYCVVEEERAGKRLDNTAISKWPKLSLDKMSLTAKPEFSLLMIGMARSQLTKYAAALGQTNPDLGAIAAMDDRFANDVLCVFEGPGAALSRSLRLLVLKQLERTKGVTFLRGALAEKPMCNCTWVESWRRRHDMNFERFVGSAKVPTWTPFIADDMPAEFANARTAVCSCMVSESPKNLDNLFNGSSSWPEHKRRRQVGCLLMALCKECGMISPLEEIGKAKPSWRVMLHNWLATSAEIPCSKSERNLLRVFAGDNSLLKQLSDGLVGDQQTEHVLFKLFSIEGGRPMENLFMWRYLGHLAGSLIATGSSSLLAFFRTLMLEPESMIEQSDYFPSMDEDIRHRIQLAFGGQAAGKKFANQWYNCEVCGLKFYIGESGPDQGREAKCPQCDAVVSGTGQRPNAEIVRDENADSSPTGYTLPKAADDDKELFFRDIHAASARTMRLLLHGTMMCGLVAQIPESNTTEVKSSSGPAPLLSRSETRKAARQQAATANVSKGKELMPKVFEHIANSDSSCTMQEDSESTYLSNHFYQDWSLLADNLSSHGEGVAMGMHNLLHTMFKNAPDAPQEKTRNLEDMEGGEREPANDNSSEWARLLTLQRRGQWEETIDEKYLLPWSGQFEESLVALHSKWSSKEDESGQFVAELRETADVKDFSEDRRRDEMPRVMAFRAEVTLTEVARRLPLAMKEQNLTLLSKLMETHTLETVGALRTLVGQFRWHSLVNQRFSGRITRQDAENMIIRDVIDGEPFAEKARWEQAFHKLENAWHDAWLYVDRFECLDIPQHLKDAVGYIDDQKPLAYAIADDKNYGICPFVLTQWLVARHNDLVQLAAVAGGYPTRQVTSGNFGPHDAIWYDKMELMGFIRDRCVTHGSAGKLILDLFEVERHLRREFNRPELSFELKPMFQWLGDGSACCGRLAALVPQRSLTPEVESRLRNEIRTPVQASVCLSKVQMAATFIKNSKDALSTELLGNMKLSDYLVQVLADDSDSIPSATARAEVCISDVDDFTRVLNKIIYPDPMEELPVQFKADLPAHIKDELEKSATGLEIETLEACVSAMESLVEKFRNEPPSENQKLSSWLVNFIEYCLGDAHCAAAVNGILPADLLIKHWQSTYLVFQKTIQK